MNKTILIGLIVLGTCATLAAADFWEKKEYTEWSDKEVRKILFDSPWSRQVQVSLRDDGNVSGGLPPGIGGNSGAGPAPGGGVGPGASGQDRGGISGGAIPGAGVGDPAPAGRSIPVIIRWMSALPVKQALVRASAGSEQGNDEQSKQFLSREDSHYVIAVVGLPEELAPSVQNADQLKAAARIDRGKKGAALTPEKVETRRQDRQIALYFFVPRSQPITQEDKNVEFELNLPEFQAKRSFKIQDMVYHGKLEI